MAKQNLNSKMRIYHRNLGFFLAGIMSIYSISGVVLIFRETNFLKSEQQIERTLLPALKPEKIGEELRLRNFKIEKEENGIIYFTKGSYNKKTGLVKYKSMELPFILEKMTNIHKSTTYDPLFVLNVFFGLSLLFFVISSFWMFLPKTTIFKKGIYFTIAGVTLTLILLFV